MLFAGFAIVIGLFARLWSNLPNAQTSNTLTTAPAETDRYEPVADPPKATETPPGQPQTPAGTLDLSTAEPGQPPPGTFSVDGQWQVRERPTTENATAQRYIELAAEPIGHHALLIGDSSNQPQTIHARIRGLARGRRLPQMGVGLYGVSGVKAVVVAAADQLQIIHDGEVIARGSYEWAKDQPFHIRLTVTQNDQQAWVAHARAWPVGADEPDDAWLVQATLPNPPPRGRPALWGTPLSEQPIQFDHVQTATP